MIHGECWAWSEFDVAVGQTWVPKMACPGKYKRGLTPVVPW